MRYLLLIAGDESQMRKATPEQGEAMTNEYAEFGKAMAERGVLQGGERLRFDQRRHHRAGAQRRGAGHRRPLR